MHKKYLKIKNISDIYFYLLVIVFIIFINKTNRVYGANNNWVEVSKTSAGVQSIDIDSINKKDKGVIEITTKYLRINTNTLKEIEENIYIMRINCVTDKFKDISINGKRNLNAKWKGKNGDKLIDDVISYSCHNV